jgi:hypothetical protein
MRKEFDDDPSLGFCSLVQDSMQTEIVSIQVKATLCPLRGTARNTAPGIYESDKRNGTAVPAFYSRRLFAPVASNVVNIVEISTAATLWTYGYALSSVSLVAFSDAATEFLPVRS